MKNFEAELLRIKDIAGMFYTVPGRTTTKLVIYGIGAPLLPDSGNLPDAPTILNFNVDLFVPDYIGYGRSEGFFTPKNCIKTFVELYKSFNNGCTATNSYKRIKKNLHYKEIFLVGRSFGGMYVLLTPKFCPEIKNICVIYPILDYVACGKILGEETIKGFMKAMEEDGYKHIYRGITSKVWERHFNNQDGLRPIENLEFLNNVKLFIGHGKKDTNISFKHSIKFYKALMKLFSKRRDQFKIKIYPEGDHDPRTSNRITKDFLNWLRDNDI